MILIASQQLVQILSLPPPGHAGKNATWSLARMHESNAHSKSFLPRHKKPSINAEQCYILLSLELVYHEQNPEPFSPFQKPYHCIIYKRQDRKCCWLNAVIVDSGWMNDPPFEVRPWIYVVSMVSSWTNKKWGQIPGAAAGFHGQTTRGRIFKTFALLL